jgi:hypothetical protein
MKTTLELLEQAKELYKLEPTEESERTLVMLQEQYAREYWEQE